MGAAPALAGCHAQVAGLLPASRDDWGWQGTREVRKVCSPLLMMQALAAVFTSQPATICTLLQDPASVPRETLNPYTQQPSTPIPILTDTAASQKQQQALHRHRRVVTHPGPSPRSHTNHTHSGQDIFLTAQTGKQTQPMSRLCCSIEHAPTSQWDTWTGADAAFKCT
jgi:hypothetical protein